MTENQSCPSKLPRSFTWIVVLVASPIAIIPWRILATHEPAWWPWMHGIILLGLLAATLISKTLKPLSRFSLIIVIIFFMGYGGGWDWGLITYIQLTDAWITWMATGPKALSEIALHLLRLTPGMVVLASLLLSGRKRQDFFLTKGDPRAIVEKSTLVSTSKPEPWIKIALIFAVVFVAGALLFLIGFNGFPLEGFIANWYLVPVALVIAAINGFNEEFTLRAAPLGELEPTIGKSDSLKATAAYFGLGHFFGVPNGVIGVLLSGFLGWLLGKSMLETKGMYVAWLVHFLTDVPIFLFLIVGGLA